MYDIIIIGKGPAGLSASLFTSRAQLKTLVIGQTQNSQLKWAHKVQNYFGIQSIDGIDLLKIGEKQAKKCGAEVIEGEIVDCTKKGKTFSVKNSKGAVYKAKAVIIATGIPMPSAGIENEKELIGKGVHTCASCDGPMYIKKKVAVIGNGNHAASDAIELTSYTKNITIISHDATFKFSKKFADQLKKFKIKLKKAKAEKFVADKFLKKIVFTDGSEEAYDGAFLACGAAGSLTFAAKLGLEIKENLLVVGENCMTNVAGVFAAGNCMGKCRQIAKNVGDGCNAGISVIRYLKASEIYFDYAKK